MKRPVEISPLAGIVTGFDADWSTMPVAVCVRQNFKLCCAAIGSKRPLREMT